ncbi:COG0325 Predicted enzyme with a TIM-barrel fold [Candidatus Nanopelagicaceae bacterium]
MTRLEEITQNLHDLQARISNPDVTLIAVTKTYPASDVQILKDLGINNFGENRTEEGAEKSAAVDGIWHFQGGIQSRKLKEIALWADVIHSLDQLSHAEKLQSLLAKPIDIFLQLSLDGDPSRGGVQEGDLHQLAQKISEMVDLNLQGLMCVLPLDVEADDGFRKVASIRSRFQSEFPQAKYLSAGMSGDFEIAIEYGATHIRVGSQILGPRTARR